MRDEDGVALQQVSASAANSGHTTGRIELDDTVCPTGPDHYRIEHDGQGFTCEAKPVVIRACANSDCSDVYAEPASITLAPTGWVGGDNFSFNGSANASLNNPSEGNITLSQVGSSPTAPLRCFSGNTETCELAFVNDGFEFIGATADDKILKDQVAELNFSEVNLRAVRSNAGVCEVLLAGDKDINLSYDCLSPGSCLRPLGAIPVSNAAGVNSASVSLAFSPQGIASLSPLVYADAGRLTLGAEAVIEGVTITSGPVSYTHLTLPTN